MKSPGPRFLAVIACLPSDPAEKEKSSNFANNDCNFNNKLPMCEGPFKPKKYVEKTQWADVHSLVTEELLLVEDKPMNTYKERDELASAVRAKMNQRSGKEDMYSILVIGSDVGVSHWSNGLFLIVKVIDQKSTTGRNYFNLMLSCPESFPSPLPSPSKPETSSTSSALPPSSPAAVVGVIHVNGEINRTSSLLFKRSRTVLK